MSICNGFAVQDAASSYSALSAGVAAVVFTGMVLVLSIRNETDPTRRRLALLVMVPTFLVLLMAALLSAEIGGLHDCRQSSMLSIPFSLLLGIGGVGTFQAIAWLLSAYDTASHELEILAGCASISILALAFVQIYITVQAAALDAGNLQHASPIGPGGIIASGGVIAVGAAIARLVALSTSRRTPPLPCSPWPMLIAMLVGMAVSVTLFDALLYQSPNYFTGRHITALTTATVWITAIATVAVLPFGVFSWRPSVGR